jgi:hypothetical protein
MIRPTAPNVQVRRKPWADWAGWDGAEEKRAVYFYRPLIDDCNNSTRDWIVDGKPLFYSFLSIRSSIVHALAMAALAPANHV